MFKLSTIVARRADGRIAAASGFGSSRGRHGGMAVHPLNIDTARILDWRPFVSDGRAGLRGSPFVHLVVAIGKVKHAGAIVVAPRHIAPLVWVGRSEHQPAVVDRSE